MKRAAPMQRKKGIGRGSSRMQRQTPMRQRSKKRAKVYREERIPLVEKLLADATACEAGKRIREKVDAAYECWGELQVHEPLTRARGGSIVDESNAMVTCTRCNCEWIPLHAKQALDLGLLRSGHVAFRASGHFDNKSTEESNG